MTDVDDAVYRQLILTLIFFFQCHRLSLIHFVSTVFLAKLMFFLQRLVSDSTVEETQNWLKINRFHNFVGIFVDFKGKLQPALIYLKCIDLALAFLAKNSFCLFSK